MPCSSNVRRGNDLAVDQAERIADSQGVENRRLPQGPSRTSGLRVVGRIFMAVGTLVVSFLAYQLIGTSFITDRQQSALADDLEARWSTTTEVAEVADPGDAFGLMQIPKIGMDVAMVEGIGVEDLKKGPGHYPDSAMPGHLGNFVVAGHRTTYGAPFFDLDQLEVGDQIDVIDGQRRQFTYIVSESKTVHPAEVGVLAKTDDARLTLITCTPKFSAAQRLIIVAELVETPVGLQTTSPLADEIDGPI